MSNFTINTKYMSRKQLLNVGRLITKAGQFGWDIDNSITEIGYNTMHGNVYIWCESEQYSLFISDFDSKIKACYSCFYDGEEIIRNASNNCENMRKWAERLYNKSAKKERNA